LIPSDPVLFVEGISLNQVQKVHQQLDLILVHVDACALHNLVFKLTDIFHKGVRYEVKLVVDPQYDVIQGLGLLSGLGHLLLRNLAHVVQVIGFEEAADHRPDFGIVRTG